jgi:hypothetical protein
LAVSGGYPRVVEVLAPRAREDLDAALLLAAALGQTEVVDVLNRHGASVYSRMDDGRTALMLAAENGHAETVTLLLDLGANRFAVNTDGQTAAQLAAKGSTAAQVAGTGGNPAVAAALNAQPASGEVSLPNLNGDPALLAARAGAAPAVGTEVAFLQGARLGRVAGDGAASHRDAGKVLEMRGYRETPLPIALEGVDGARAQVRLLFGHQQELSLAAGDPIPNTPLRVVRVQRKFEASKLNAGRPMDVSVIELEDSATGSRRVVIANHEASAHDPYAVLQEIPAGRLLIAKPGEQFSTADGSTWTVIDVRPTQVIIERADGAGAPITLPLAGNHGKS